MAWHFTGPPGSDVDDLGFVRPWENEQTTKNDQTIENCEEQSTAEQRQAYSAFWSAYLPILVRRRKRWEKLDPRRFTTNLQRFVHKGIPAPFRKHIWLRNCPPRGPPVTTEVPDKVVDAIRLDLPRTFPDNQFLKSRKSQNALGRALFAVAQHHPKVGYCQGLNFVAALLLLVLNDETKAIDLLVHLVGQRSDYYDEQMSGLRRDTRVLHMILRTNVPKVASTLESLDVGLDILMGKWFVCWFIESLPMETVLRIWDCLIYEGDEWLFRIAVRLLRSRQNEISRAKSIDQLITIFQDIGKSRQALFCHLLIKEAGEEPISQKTIDELRVQCVAEQNNRAF